MNDYMIRKATSSDLDQISNNYDDLCDYLQTIGNPPGWTKGRYPVRQVAEEALQSDSLYVIVAKDGIVAGSMAIDNCEPDPYKTIDWKNDYTGKDVVILHTLVIHPNYMRRGYARKMVEYTIEKAREMHAKCIRFDTFKKNFPAQKLYDSLGFERMGQVNLFKDIPELDFYETFQMLL